MSRLSPAEREANERLLAEHKARLKLVQPAVGPVGTTRQKKKRLQLTSAAQITVQPVHWLWAGRLALGSLALLGGREGIGKSTVAYQLAADVTRGRLDGDYHAKPRAVLIAATEDSWSHTIVPRLIAAGADLTLVYRVEVTEDEAIGLSLPNDLAELQQDVARLGAALVLLDPLLSRLDAGLDTHKDSDTRRALEPLSRFAEETGTTIVGLIHVNKSSTTDPLTSLMASRAFAAVARAVLFVMRDPDNESVRLLGQPKNNLGRTDLPTLTFRIEEETVAHTAEGPVTTGRVVWLGESERSITEAMEEANNHGEVRTQVAEAVDWLRGHLLNAGGTDDSTSIKKAARQEGHAPSTLARARHKLRLRVEAGGFPRRTFWSLPPESLGAAVPQPGGVSTTSAAGATALIPRGQIPGES